MRRTTVRIDDDLLRELKSLAQREQISLAKLFSKVLRRGLSAEKQAGAKTRRPFRQTTVDLGQMRVPPGLDHLSRHKALAIAAALEDEELLRKLTSGK